jgi:hypothetical protein
MASMVESRTMLAAALAALALSCGAAPARPIQPAKWQDFRPTTPLPSFAQELGQPCAEDWGGWPLLVRCGRGRRAAIATFTDHQSVTGRWQPTADDPPHYRDDDPPVHFAYPPRPAAKSDGKHAYTQFWLYIDGPFFWLRADAVASQFGGAALTIVDRRLLSEANERWLAELLHLANGTDIYDDQCLARSVQQYRDEH